MQNYIKCVACGEYVPEDQACENARGHIFCKHCDSITKEEAKPVTMSFDVSKRPVFQHADKYGSMDTIYEQLLNGQPLEMSGLAFEYFCADVLLIDGFTNIIVTKASADNGVDIMAQKNGESYIFQCKCLTHTCSNKAVQEIVSANTIYRADHMGVICNTKFSTSAKVLANTNKVELYSIGTIKHMLDKYACDFYET